MTPNPPTPLATPDDQAVAANPKPRCYHALTPRMLENALASIAEYWASEEADRVLRDIMAWKPATLTQARRHGTRVSKARRLRLCGYLDPDCPTAELDETWRQLAWPSWKWRHRRAWWLRLGLWLRIFKR